MRSRVSGLKNQLSSSKKGSCDIRRVSSFCPREKKKKNKDFYGVVVDENERYKEEHPDDPNIGHHDSKKLFEYDWNVPGMEYLDF